MSFKETLNYVLHDPKAKSADRVDWTLTRNLFSDVADAWYEMFETYKAQDSLKAASGVEARGRKNASPVLHYSLSWAPGQEPTKEHMQRTALSSLQAMGLSEHEAVIAGHSDKGHLHLHVVVNTVHPQTGRTAELRFSKLELSKWALAYEKEHGIVCDARVQQTEDRRILKDQRSKESEAFLRAAANGDYSSDRADYVPLKDTSPKRKEWIFAKAAREKLAASILASLTSHDSTFTKRDLAKLVDAKAKDRASYEALMAQIERSAELVRLTPSGDRMSTREMVDIEADLVRMARDLSAKVSHPTRDAIQRGLSSLPMSSEQAAALKHVTSSAALANVVGFAGSGKSHMLGAARLVWEDAGYNVIGATLSGVAAQGLELGSGIKSGTIHRLLWSLKNGKATLSPKDVLVIDEAGMVDSRMMHSLVSAVSEAGAKVVMVGDPNQLQAIQAGAAFRAIVERTNAAQMSEVRRQRTRWEREATVDLAQGRTGRAVSAYQDAGRFHALEDKHAAIETMISRWMADRAQLPVGGTTVMLASTNKSVDAINEAVRGAMKKNGVLGRETMLVALDEGIDRPRTEFTIPVAVGERLMFRKNDYTLDVRNGTQGIILAFGPQKMRMRIDGPKPRVVDIDLTQYRNFDYGYAMTVHKAQGITADRVHVLAEKNMDSNLSYVALSRHKETMSLYWSQDEFSSQWKLQVALARTRAKDTTLDYMDRQPPLRIGPEREPGSLGKSVSRTFAGTARSDSSRVEKLRAESSQWRSQRGSRPRGFGLER